MAEACPMPLTIAPAAHAAMLAGARTAAPCEACGLLLGQGDHIHTATRAANVHLVPETHFEIDPAALIAAHKAAREGGARLLGYWHSHPNGRGGPSPADHASASGDGRFWAIVANEAITVWLDGAHGFEPLSYALHQG